MKMPQKRTQKERKKPTAVGDQSSYQKARRQFRLIPPVECMAQSHENGLYLNNKQEQTNSDRMKQENRSLSGMLSTYVHRAMQNRNLVIGTAILQYNSCFPAPPLCIRTSTHTHIHKHARTKKTNHLQQLCKKVFGNQSHSRQREEDVEEQKHYP